MPNSVELEIKNAVDFLNSDDGFQLSDDCREVILKLVGIAKKFVAEWKTRYEVAEDNVWKELVSTNDSCHWCEKIIRSQIKKDFKGLVEKDSLVKLIIRAACNGYGMDDRSDAEELAEFLSTEIKNMIDV